MKKSGVPLTRGRVSSQYGGGGGGLPPENIFSRHFEHVCMIWTKNLQNMIETPFPFFITKSRVKFWYLEIFSEKSILAYISLKINIFRSAMFYYVIVTSYIDNFLWFWYQRKEKTLPYTMVPYNYTLGVSISSSQGVVTTTPLHYKRQWYAFLFTDNHDVLFDKRMIWFSSLYC